MPHICRQLEIGRIDPILESIVKWEGNLIPVPCMYYRTSSTVAFADICAPEYIIKNDWNDIITCAKIAGENIGIPAIIDAPEAILSVYDLAFKSCLMARIGSHSEGGSSLFQVGKPKFSLPPIR